MDDGPVLVVLMCEGCAEEVIEVAPDSVEGFCSGFAMGGAQYGAGSCYAVPESQIESYEYPREDDRTEARTALASHRDGLDDLVDEDTTDEPDMYGEADITGRSTEDGDV